MRELKYKLLFITPEKIIQNKNAKDLIQSLYNNSQINRFVIDEVHCVSHWGQDFRGDYLKLSCLKLNFPGVPLLGLTATATEQVKLDIAKILKMEDVKYFQSSFNRPNLHYEILPK